MRTSIKRFAIVDCVSDTVVTYKDAVSGKQALQSFRNNRMSTGIYDILRIGNEWHMLSSFGSDFRAEFVCGISGNNYITSICKIGKYMVVNGDAGEWAILADSEQEAKRIYLKKCLEKAYDAIPPALRKRYQ